MSDERALLINMAACSGSEVVFDGKNNSRIVKWKIEPGSRISIGSVVLLYNDVTEGELSAIPKKLKTNVVGTVTELVAKEDDVLVPGSVILKYEGCLHPVVMKDMCAECGADLRLREEEKTHPTASVAMIHCIPELMVSQEQAQILGKADEERLLKNRKLVLLVDLDQTLIHTTNDDVPPTLKDVYHFQLYGSQSLWYHTRLRPGTKEFLRQMSELYELHICTFGARLYAHMIARFLDKDGKYFSHRILSRDECFSHNSKTANLKALFPCGDSLVCIIDDREDVWNFTPNLVHVKPYHFFQHTGDINAPPGLSKNEQDSDVPGFSMCSDQSKECEVKSDKKIMTCQKKRKKSSTNGIDSDTNMTTSVPTTFQTDKLEKEKKETNLDLTNDSNVAQEDNTNAGQHNSTENCCVMEIGTENVLVDMKEVKESKCMPVAGDEMDENIPDQNTLESDKVGKDDEAKSLRSSVSCENECDVSNTSKESADEAQEHIVEKRDSGGENREESDNGNKKAEVNNEDKNIKGSDSENLEESDNGNKAKVNDEDKTIKGCENENRDNGNKRAKLNDEDKNIKECENENREESDNGNKADVINEDSADGDKNIKSNENREESDNENKKADVNHEDGDDYLMYLPDILRTIHKAFYDMYDQLRSQGNFEIPDLKNVVPYVRSKVLRSTNIVFSGIFPMNMPPEQSRAWIVAKSLGANIQKAIIPSRKGIDKKDVTTHIVAARLGTAKVNEARKLKGVHVVTSDWLWCCAERWERVDEKLFPLTKDVTVDHKSMVSRSSPVMGVETLQQNTSSSAKTIKSPPQMFPTYDRVTGKRIKPNGSQPPGDNKVFHMSQTSQLSKEGDSQSVREVSSAGTSSSNVVNFASSINPLMSFSTEDIAKMDQEVEDILDESDSESEGYTEERTKKLVLKTNQCSSTESETETSSQESMSGDHPHGWGNLIQKRKREENSEGDDLGSESEKERVKYPRNELPHHSECSNNQQSDSDDFNESIGSVDEEMAAAVEREFLGL